MITCPSCGKKSPIEDWKKTEEVFQSCHCMPVTRLAYCPVCGKRLFFKGFLAESEIISFGRTENTLSD